MAIKVAFVCKRLGAVVTLTFVRPLASVHALMTGKVRLLAKCLMACLAHVWAQLRVCATVCGQVALLRKLLAAVAMVADERLLASMNAAVHGQLLLLLKLAPACLADE